MLLQSGHTKTAIMAATLCVALASVLSVDAAARLQITELNFHPAAPTQAEQDAGFTDKDQFEFIEIRNTGDETASLAGMSFVDGVQFSFSGSSVTSLAPGAFVLVVNHRSAFQRRYGTGLPVAGAFASGQLSDDGENLRLATSSDVTVIEFAYGAGGSWPKRASGLGSSLQLKDFDDDPNDSDTWRSSTERHGTPGAVGMQGFDSIRINEILAHTDLPLEDAVELFNPTDTSVDISGWYLSDDVQVPAKYRFPNNTVVPPGGYRVAYQIQFDALNPLIPFAFSSVHGEEVWLMTDHPQTGQPHLFVDDLDFPSSENGVSFGRIPNGTGSLTAMQELSFGTDVSREDPPNQILVFRTGKGAANTEPKVGPAVISRIMYHPPDGQYEFVEIRNITTSPLPLYDPLHATNRFTLVGAVEFEFPEITLEAGGSVVVGGSDPANELLFNPAALRAQHSIPADIEIIGPFAGRLDNAGEKIELFKPDPPQTTEPDIGFVPQILVEKVDYNDKSPWPEDVLGTGRHLQRIDVNAFGNVASNWRSATYAALEPPVIGSIVVVGAEVQIRGTAVNATTVHLEESEEFTIWTDRGMWPVASDRFEITITPTLPEIGFFRVRAE